MQPITRGKKRALELVSEVEKRLLADRLDPRTTAQQLELILYPAAQLGINLGEQRLEEVRRNFMLRYGLNKQQMQVLEMIARGLSNEEIADVMEKAAATIRYHISLLFKNIGVRNRASATRLWVQAQSEAREVS